MLRKAAALKAFVAFLDVHYGGRIETLCEAAPESPLTVREQMRPPWSSTNICAAS